MTDDLATWLLTQIAEDERIARAACEVVVGMASKPAGPHWSANGGMIVDENGYELWDDEGSSTLRMDRDHAAYGAHWDPARVLAECDSKRRIIEMHTGKWMGPGDPPRSTPYCPLCSRPTRDEDLIRVWPCGTLKLLASVFADRPGYRQEWAPCAST